MRSTIENHSVQIIGGADGPTSVFLAGKVPADGNQAEEFFDLNQVIFVYCRSGRRSKEASAKLAALGYTNIYEFGGILDWDGEIEK